MARVKTTSWKPSNKWITQEVCNEFGLKRHFNFQVIDDFLLDIPTLSDKEQQQLDELYQTIRIYYDSWWEADFKMEVIASLLTLPKLHSPNRIYRAFYDYSFRTILKEQSIKGKIDCVLAKGFQIASQPLFFFQQYKSETQPDSDPLGQLLMIMLMARQIDIDEKSDYYGFYSIREMWYFVILKENNFVVSQSFNANNRRDLDVVTAILKKIKHLYEVKLNLIPS